jgi:hypothetical protein
MWLLLLQLLLLLGLGLLWRRLPEYVAGKAEFRLSGQGVEMFRHFQETCSRRVSRN